MNKNKVAPKRCPKCGKTIFYEICPYCHTNTAKIKSEQNCTSEEAEDEKGTERTAGIWGVILLIICIIFLISQITKSDGTCERCDKDGVYEIGGKSYCEEHYTEVIEEIIPWK